MKGKIIINATLIWFEGTGKTIPPNSILEFSIISDLKMRNVILWHWFIKNLVGTWPRNDVDATYVRRIDVITTSCACWEFGPPCPPQYSKPCPPPPPPQYSKPSYAYVITAGAWGVGCAALLHYCTWTDSIKPIFVSLMCSLLLEELHPELISKQVWAHLIPSITILTLCSPNKLRWITN